VCLSSTTSSYLEDSVSNLETKNAYAGYGFPYNSSLAYVYLARQSRPSYITYVLSWQLISAPEMSHHQATNKDCVMEVLLIVERRSPLPIIYRAFHFTVSVSGVMLDQFQSSN
jgi:hypothetical protein